MKVIVSACLAGDNCKYNGGNNFNQKMMELSTATKSRATDFLQNFALRPVTKFWILRNTYWHSKASYQLGCSFR